MSDEHHTTDMTPESVDPANEELIRELLAEQLDDLSIAIERHGMSLERGLKALGISIRQGFSAIAGALVGGGPENPVKITFGRESEGSEDE